MSSIYRTLHILVALTLAIPGRASTDSKASDSLSEIGHGPTYVLVGGGYSTLSSQASIERNAKLFLDLMRVWQVPRDRHEIYFGGGNDSSILDVAEATTPIPLEWQLLNSLLGGYPYPHDLTLRHNTLEKIDGPNTTAAVKRALKNQEKQDGPLRFYYTGHGSHNKDDYEHNHLNLWDGTLTVQEFTELLDGISPKRSVQVMMVQCFSGGFAQINQLGGKVDTWSSSANRCGFFSQKASLPASGCYYELSNQEEYSLYFFKAHQRANEPGKTLAYGDFDQDDRVTAMEAHHYALQHLRSPDRPLTTSQQFLRQLKAMGVSVRASQPEDILQAAQPIEAFTMRYLASQLNIDLEDFDSLSELNREKKTLMKKWRVYGKRIFQDDWKPIGDMKKPRGAKQLQDSKEYQELVRDLQDRHSLLNLPFIAHGYQNTGTQEWRRSLLGIMDSLKKHRHFEKVTQLISEGNQEEQIDLYKETVGARFDRLMYLLETVALRQSAQKEIKYADFLQRYERILACERERFFY